MSDGILIGIGISIYALAAVRAFIVMLRQNEREPVAMRNSAFSIFLTTLLWPMLALFLGAFLILADIALVQANNSTNTYPMTPEEE